MNDLNDFKSQVKKSFQLCRNDIEFLKKENTNLKEKLNKNEKIIRDLKSELKALKIAFEMLNKTFIESITNIQKNNNQNNSNNKINKNLQNEDKINMKNNKINIISNENNSLENKSNKIKKDPYEELIKIKARINKKEMLKQKMLSLINDGLILAELKYLIVEHYRYCSKATFYNYLKELELEKKIIIKRELNKNKIYINENIKT